MKSLIFVLLVCVASIVFANDVISTDYIKQILIDNNADIREAELRLKERVATSINLWKFSIVGLAAVGAFILGVMFNFISGNKKQLVKILADLNDEKQARIETCATVERKLTEFRLSVEKSYVRTEAIGKLLEARINPLEKKIDQMISILGKKI